MKSTKKRQHNLMIIFDVDFILRLLGFLSGIASECWTGGSYIHVAGY
jgi:hypothetical protein